SLAIAGGIAMPLRPRDREREERDRAERLAYVGALAAALVHELRTPLHAMLLNAQMLVEDTAHFPPEARARFERRAKRICSDIQALNKMLESFLTFARPPKLEPRPTDLNRFLREIIEFEKPVLDAARIRVEDNLAPDMYPVVLDQGQFTHVVLNLLRNAVEAIQQRQQNEPEVEGVIKISSAEDEMNGTITIRIEDNGVGIRPGDEEKIFELFYTTKKKGTGLGLGIVRRIVEDHRGRIALAPPPPQGACFEITLPRGRFLEFTQESPAIVEERAEEKGNAAAPH
ncbi:MAG: ATP-binding protein, partial [Planctomycetota bacterium]|nr:ATP-binding protein [Planctomycetota bacterium]